jgi:hypothetical protein
LRAAPRLSEYTLDAHRALYKPIAHISVKQDKYLGLAGDGGGGAT